MHYWLLGKNLLSLIDVGEAPMLKRSLVGRRPLGPCSGTVKVQATRIEYDLSLGALLQTKGDTVHSPIGQQLSRLRLGAFRHGLWRAGWWKNQHSFLSRPTHVNAWRAASVPNNSADRTVPFDGRPRASETIWQLTVTFYFYLPRQ